MTEPCFTEPCARAPAIAGIRRTPFDILAAAWRP